MTQHNALFSRDWRTPPSLADTHTLLYGCQSKLKPLNYSPLYLQCTRSPLILSGVYRASWNCLCQVRASPGQVWWFPSLSTHSTLQPFLSWRVCISTTTWMRQIAGHWTLRSYSELTWQPSSTASPGSSASSTQETQPVPSHHRVLLYLSKVILYLWIYQYSDWSSDDLIPWILPTPGQVQSKKCIEEVLHFAYEENLFVMADEVSSNADI